MDLFVVEGNVVKPSVHALMIPPFSTIWEQDSDPKKSYAIMLFTYIELMCSHKKSNVFKGYPLSTRSAEIIKRLFPDADPNFIGLEVVEQGIEFYNKVQIEAAPIIQFYEAARVGAEKVTSWLTTFDMETKNPRTGLPLYKPRDITSALKDTYDVMNTLNSMEEKVYEQIFESVRTQKNKEINIFET
jgi:hypothetical protein